MNFYDDKIINKIKESLSGQNKSIIVPEGDEDRVIQSLQYTPEIKKILLGNELEITNKIKKEYPDTYQEIMKMVQIIDSQDYITEDLVHSLVEKRNNKISYEDAKQLLQHRNYLATMILEQNGADALVGGSQYSTADILRPAFQIIKPKPGNSIVSSYFIMRKNDEVCVFADCAININPTAEQLKEIAVQTIESSKKIDLNPKVAFLSFSTKGSGKSESVDKVRNAYNLLIEENPKYKDFVDGEAQFDTAVSKRVAKIKAPKSKVLGDANVFIFPNLESGNIGYKIAEHMGGWQAIGPLLQGLNKPVNDLSRGTTPQTIAKVMYLSLR